MLCSNCSSKEAAFHYKYIKNGVKSEIHLCSDCAKELGYIKENDSFFNPISLLGEFFSSPSLSHNKSADTRCNVCGTSFEEIRRNGFLGCDKCYEVFSNPIDTILSRIQPSTVHKGKLSGSEGKKIERDNTLKNLKEELQKAILNEKYEEAAVIRDKIKAFEKEEGKQNG